MSSVKVAVRVRPFNTREKEMNSKTIIEMGGEMTKITDPETGKEKKFFFDFSYWSHDGYDEDPDSGILTAKPGSNYADQETVFKDLGIGVLDNAFEGYHTCLFAYGQTGSGKSYSIVGYGNNKGIIPMACEEIFARTKKMSADPAATVKFDILVSMLEIYNECVHDLFSLPANRPKGGLKVREHPKTGVFVENLSTKKVNSYDEIQRAIDNGTANRTIGATLMNSTSSRAHTDPSTQLPTTRKESHINLVDLAGSERAGSTGATGARLAEGSNINKSLSILGKVISTLAEKSSGKGKGVAVPYRESKLTRILQNALGGNSKTLMIAALSPASVNFDETLGTLRYADQVKSIRNVAVINESPQEKLIRELREENERLKKQMMGGDFSATGGGATGMDDDEISEMKAQHQREMEENMRELENLKKSFAQRMSEQKTEEVAFIAEEKAEKETKITEPHLSNLNQDPFLSGKIKHQFKNGGNILGKRDKDNPPHIMIGGLGVQQRHCVIEFDQGTRSVSLIPNEEFDKAKVLVNGKLVTDMIDLKHNDRLLFGNYNYFLVVDPNYEIDPELDFEYASNEVYKDQITALKSNEEDQKDMERKLEEMTKQIEEERQKAEKVLESEKERQREEMEAEMQAKRDEIMAQMDDKAGKDQEEKLAAMQEELERVQKEQDEKLAKRVAELEKEAQGKVDKKKKEKMKEELRLRMQRDVDEKLGQAIPKINEVNEICLSMGKINYLYAPDLRTEVKGGEKVSKVMIKAYPDHNQDFFNLLELDEFTEKYYLIKEVFDEYNYDLDNYGSPKTREDDIDEDNRIFGIGIKDDYHLIGQAHIYLDALANLLDTQNDMTPLIDNKGKINGEVKYSLVPSYSEGGIETNLLHYDSVEDLEGKTMNVLLKIISARGLAKTYANELYSKYIWIDENGEEFATTPIEKPTTNPEFNYEKNHELFLTKYVIDKMWESALSISIYGKMSREKLEQIQKTVGVKSAGDTAPAGSPMHSKTQAKNTPAAAATTTKAVVIPTNETSDQKLNRLEGDNLDKENEIKKLKRELSEAKRAKGSSCCNIF